MKKLISLLFAFLFYIILFPFTALILILGPIITVSDLSNVFKYEVPKLAFGLPALVLLGFILFLSMKVSSLKWIYKKFPVLLPFLQMGYLSFLALQIGLEFANLWADNNAYPKGVAIVLALLSFVVGRIFLSYWYYKYPISYKIHK
ncbi:hypothetical protein [Bacillus salipaludis]|uniref:Uncharacterized protein n=1 Tax=Bacillus salipaludis TaxID=2547811 RepID=A0AA90R877_9BACI|nr:hypothetical protein [Bacillus salipaludis]MDQ6598113.1 hypothetical protein [Bacillus salipaludis]